MIDLQRGVSDLEPFLEQALQTATQLVAILAGRHYDVGGQCREA
jgi:hypothetical protein